jgi:hypothetical protein
LHSAQTHPEVLRTSWGRPALVMESPDLRMQGLPAGLALCHALLQDSR